jgi:pyrroline-5-carboxylate reductase
MKAFKLKTGFIGAGNMTEAMIGAVIRSNIFAPEHIFASDVIQERLDMLSDVYKISTINDNFKLFLTCDIIIVAVKPQQISHVLAAISEQIDHRLLKRKLFISIAAGYPIKKIEDVLYQSLEVHSRKMMPIIRVMPNTPALVLAGMCGMAANQYANKEDITIARTILEATGKVIEFSEDKLDAVTALSGSGPAYVFYLAEAMIEGGVKAGLDPDKAYVLAIETLKGAAALLSSQNESPELLRKKVTSPGGTTEAAIKVLDDGRVKHNIVDAISAAAQRSKELADES